MRRTGEHDEHDHRRNVLRTRGGSSRGSARVRRRSGRQRRRERRGGPRAGMRSHRARLARLDRRQRRRVVVHVHVRVDAGGRVVQLVHRVMVARRRAQRDPGRHSRRARRRRRRERRRAHRHPRELALGGPHRCDGDGPRRGRRRREHRHGRRGGTRRAREPRVFEISRRGSRRTVPRGARRRRRILNARGGRRDGEILGDSRPARVRRLRRRPRLRSRSASRRFRASLCVSRRRGARDSRRDARPTGGKIRVRRRLVAEVRTGRALHLRRRGGRLRVTLGTRQGARRLERASALSRRARGDDGGLFSVAVSLWRRETRSGFETRSHDRVVVRVADRRRRRTRERSRAPRRGNGERRSASGYARAREIRRRMVRRRRRRRPRVPGFLVSVLFLFLFFGRRRVRRSGRPRRRKRRGRRAVPLRTVAAKIRSAATACASLRLGRRRGPGTRDLRSSRPGLASRLARRRGRRVRKSPGPARDDGPASIVVPVV